MSTEDTAETKRIERLLQAPIDHLVAQLEDARADQGERHPAPYDRFWNYPPGWFEPPGY